MSGTAGVVRSHLGEFFFLKDSSGEVLRENTWINSNNVIKSRTSKGLKMLEAVQSPFKIFFQGFFSFPAFLRAAFQGKYTPWGGESFRLSCQVI